MSEVRMSHLSWTDYEAIVKAKSPVLMVPLGAIEQHGPHLPLATDYLIPSALCERVARRANALVAPALSYGYKSIPRSGGGQHFCGTTSLDSATLVNQIRDLVREFVRHGVSKIAFIVGHLENQWFATEGCDLALRDIRMLGQDLPQLMRVGYWEFIDQKTTQQVFGNEAPDWSLEHAGIMETSMMLELHPDLVRMERLEEQSPARFPVYDLWPYDPATVPASGILNTAKGSTREKGRVLCDQLTESMAQALDKAFGKKVRQR